MTIFQPSAAAYRPQHSRKDPLRCMCGTNTHPKGTLKQDAKERERKKCNRKTVALHNPRPDLAPCFHFTPCVRVLFRVLCVCVCVSYCHSVLLTSLCRVMYGVAMESRPIKSGPKIVHLWVILFCCSGCCCCCCAFPNRD